MRFPAHAASRAAISLVLVILMLLTSSIAHAEKLSLQPDPAPRTMEGFGASGAWWSTWVGDYPADKRAHLLDLLFTDKGIALSIFRYNLPAGGGKEIAHPERATVPVERSPGVFDLQADRKALDILRQVRQRGVERFVLFANSPPARLTRNGLTSGGDQGGSNLKVGAETDFARYLLALAIQVRKECDLPHVTLSPINEPQWKWGEKWRGQEGCHYTPAEAAAVIAAVVAEAQSTDIAIEAPESGDWKSMMPYAEAMFADPAIAKALKHFAVHSYWSDRPGKIAAAKAFTARFPDIKLVMSEYCQMKHEHDVGIKSALDLASVIHDDLTIGRVVSWQWWLAIAAGGYGDGLIYAHPKNQTIELTKRLWVLGHWSKFVRPGFRTLQVIGDGQLKATAFQSADSKRTVCVLLNTTTTAVNVDLQTPAGGKTTAFVTDPARDLAPADAGTCPAQSVMTIVIDH